MLQVEVHQTSDVSWVQYWRVPWHISWPWGLEISIFVAHKPGWVFLFLNPYVFLHKEMYHDILLIVPSSLWHSLTECRQSRKRSVPALVLSHQWCQFLFVPASQFAIRTLTVRRTTIFRGLFWWRLMQKSCGEGPMQFWFLSSPIFILPANNSTPPIDTFMWPNKVNRTAYLS